MSSAACGLPLICDMTRRAKNAPNRSICRAKNGAALDRCGSVGLTRMFTSGRSTSTCTSCIRLRSIAYGVGDSAAPENPYSAG